MLVPSQPLRRRTSGLLVSCMLFLALLLSACGNSTQGTGTSTSATTIKPPTGLIQSGQLLVGSDTTYPPMESLDPTTNTYVGFDIDLITDIAQQMGLKEVTQKANFDTIISDLNNKRYDVVISSVTINSDREKQADFVPYFTAGESLLVAKGNPSKIKALSDLCGKTVGVQTGTTEQADLATANTACTSKGKPAIQVTSLESQDDVINLLATGRVIAAFQDSPVSDYYNTQHPGQFEVGGNVINTAPYGIVVRKNDPSMLSAIKAAFKVIHDNGTYDKLFKKWNLTLSQKI